MKKGKLFVFVLLVGIFILSTDAFALPVGKHLGFYDIVFPSNPEYTWEHSLGDYNFIPHLEGNEPNIIIDHALLILSLNFTTNTLGKFKASVALDGNVLGNIIYSSWHKRSVNNWHWWRSITDPGILNEISIDRLASIEINTFTGWGKLKSVSHSVLLGSGVVGPEPISMALVGAGLVGLPIAVRFRRLLRK